MLLRVIPLGILLGFLFLTVAHGMVSTYLPIFANTLTSSPFFVGSLYSAYFLGLLIGNFHIEHVISKYGQSRVLVMLLGVLMASGLVMGCVQSVPLWIVLRFFVGIAMGSTMIVVELYALTVSDSKRRYALMMYFVALYGGMTVGSCVLTIWWASARPEVLLCTALTVLCQIFSLMSMSAVKPITLETSCDEDTTRDYFGLIKSQPTSLWIIFLGGVLVGSSTAHVGSLGETFGFSLSYISLMISVSLGGGALFAFPTAMLAQWQGDLRTVLVFLLLGAVTDLVLLLGSWSEGLLCLTLLFVGVGSGFPLYMLGISRISKKAKTSQDFIRYAALAGIIFSTGAVIGPVCAAVVIKFIDTGLLVFNGSGRALLFVYLIVSVHFARESTATVPQVGASGQKVGLDALTVGHAPMFHGVLQRTRFKKKKKRLTKRR